MQPLCKTAWRFLKKLKIELPYDPAIPLLGVYPKELQSGSPGNSSAPVFTAALVMIPKMQTQTKGLLTDERIKKIWFATQWNIIQH